MNRADQGPRNFPFHNHPFFLSAIRIPPIRRVQRGTVAVPSFVADNAIPRRRRLALSIGLWPAEAAHPSTTANPAWGRLQRHGRKANMRENHSAGSFQDPTTGLRRTLSERADRVARGGLKLCFGDPRAARGRRCTSLAFNSTRLGKLGLQANNGFGTFRYG